MAVQSPSWIALLALGLALVTECAAKKGGGVACEGESCAGIVIAALVVFIGLPCAWSCFKSCDCDECDDCDGAIAAAEDAAKKRADVEEVACLVTEGRLNTLLTSLGSSALGTVNFKLKLEQCSPLARNDVFKEIEEETLRALRIKVRPCNNPHWLWQAHHLPSPTDDHAAASTVSFYPDRRRGGDGACDSTPPSPLPPLWCLPATVAARPRRH